MPENTLTVSIPASRKDFTDEVVQKQIRFVSGLIQVIEKNLINNTVQSLTDFSLDYLVAIEELKLWTDILFKLGEGFDYFDIDSHIFELYLWKVESVQAEDTLKEIFRKTAYSTAVQAVARKLQKYA